MLAKLDRAERLRLMKFVCSFAWADLEVVEPERKFVHKMIKKLGLAKDEIALVNGWLEVPPPADEVDPADVPREDRRLFLEVARQVIESDGEISEEERENITLLEQLLT